MRKTYTAEQREQLIAEVRATGEKVRDVAKRMGVSSSTAYLWMKPPAPSAPGFARVVRAQAAAASHLLLEVGGVKLHVGSDFDAGLLRRVVAVLSTGS
jgi:hypothetical protein